MSIVIRESHANNSQPLWLSAAGGEIPPITVEGTITADEDIIFQASDNAAVTNGRIVASDVATGRLYVQADTDIAFTKIGVGLTNTVLTLGTGGNNDDVLTVGGTIDTDTIVAKSFSPLRGDITYAGIGAGQQAMTFTGALSGAIIEENALYLMSFDVLITSGGIAVAPAEYTLTAGTNPGTSVVAWAGTVSIPAAPEFRIFSVTGLVQGFGPGSQSLQGALFLPGALPAGSTIQSNNVMLLRIA